MLVTFLIIIIHGFDWWIEFKSAVVPTPFHMYLHVIYIQCSFSNANTVVLYNVFHQACLIPFSSIMLLSKIWFLEFLNTLKDHNFKFLRFNKLLYYSYRNVMWRYRLENPPFSAVNYLAHNFSENFKVSKYKTGVILYRRKKFFWRCKIIQES